LATTGASTVVDFSIVVSLDSVAACATLRVVPNASATTLEIMVIFM
jgi:hypothetical protein